ncbi:upf0317 protein c14orf159,mitochondrial [Plakobranchus ocellatus]|uniref:Upf0317 protein c14orf159,mitochondrial n=1 Tax=Plakobranchus ocellatus TaxID=259542 RepID=A0AAV4BYS9_9GAST|nr:upf0317 protein c14orf159,mitochondrial [Plakobranchus ocellatus]
MNLLMWRKPRHELEDRAKPKDRSYAFIVKVQRERGDKSVPVCVKDFCAMFGITHRRVRTIQAALRETEYLKPLFKQTCPVPTRPIREILFRSQDSMIFSYRNNWNGRMESAVVMPRQKTLAAKIESQKRMPLNRLYSNPIPTSEAKYKDLQVLKKFCDPQNAAYYDSLPHDGQIADDLHQDLSESNEDGTNS